MQAIQIFSLAFSIILYAYVTFVFWQRRAMYPIMERSPYLTMITGTTLLANLVLTCLNVNSFGFFLMLNFNYFQTVKIYRLCHALGSANSTLATWFYGSQPLMIIVGIIVTSGVQMLFYFWSIDTKLPSLVISQVVELLNVIATYLMRRIDSEYQMQRECIWLIVLSMAINLIELTKLFVFYFLYAMLIMLLPTLRAKNYHEILAPRIITQYFKYFIQVPICLNSFYVFLQSLDLTYQSVEGEKKINAQISQVLSPSPAPKDKFTRMVKLMHERNLSMESPIHIKQPSRTQSEKAKLKSSTLLLEHDFNQTLFDFYLEIQKTTYSELPEMTLEKSIKVLKEYFCKQNTQLDVEPPKFRKIKSLPTKDMGPSECEDWLSLKIDELLNSGQHEYIKEIVKQYYYITDEYLQNLYEVKFKKTVAFRTLERWLEQNERITLNLIQLNMTCFTQS